jgi:hypothetical protein
MNIQSQKHRIGQGALLLGALMLVAGCSNGFSNLIRPAKNRVMFEGLYYPARISAERGDRAAFTVTVNRADQGIDGAREAGRYEATKYCIKQYGRSDTEWSVGPDTEGLAISNDQLVLVGRCKA